MRALPPGQRNSIADVPGVTIGHVTIAEAEVLTGVTAVLPHDGDLFTDRPVAAAYVLNGFGKDVSLLSANDTFSSTHLPHRCGADEPSANLVTALINELFSQGITGTCRRLIVTEGGCHADEQYRSAHARRPQRKA